MRIVQARPQSQPPAAAADPRASSTLLLWRRLAISWKPPDAGVRDGVFMKRGIWRHDRIPQGRRAPAGVGIPQVRGRSWASGAAIMNAFPQDPHGSNCPRDFIRVDASAIHGLGVFASATSPRHRVIAYTGDGRRARLVEARTRGRDLTYVLHVDEGHVIDGAVVRQRSPLRESACAPNCEIYVFDGVPYLYARETFLPGG